MVDGGPSVIISGMNWIPVWYADNSNTHQMVRHSISIGNYMLLNAIIPKLHSKACNCLLILYFIKCSLIFQDSNNSSYMRSGDMTTFLGRLFRPP